MSESEIETCGVAAPSHSSQTHYDDNEVDLPCDVPNLVPEVDDDEEVDCSGAVATAPFMPPLKLKRRWLRTATEYSVGKVFAALLVVDPALTAAAYFEIRFQDGGFGSDSTWTATCVVAVVLCHYCLSSLTDERGDTTDAQRDAVRLPKKFTTLGFCDYVIDDVHPLASPHWLGMEGPPRIRSDWNRNTVRPAFKRAVVVR